MKSLLPVLSFSVFFIPASYSQTIDTKKLDSLFDMLRSREMATGSAAISINGKIVYQKAIGFSHLTAPGRSNLE